MSVHGIRRGLPRVAGGDPWPAEGIAEAILAEIAEPTHAQSAPVEVTAQTTVTLEDIATAAQVDNLQMVEPPQGLRRGLPRVVGGEPWPTALVRTNAAVANAAAKTETAPVARAAQIPDEVTTVPDAISVPTAVAPESRVSTASVEGFRQGLPRTRGGDPWPPLTSAPVVAAEPVAAETPIVAETLVAAETPIVAKPVSAVSTGVPAPAPAPASAKPRTTLKERWLALPRLSQSLFVAVGFLVVAGVAILVARALLTLPVLADFVERYPGETELPEGAPVGLPAWLGWQHFFNVFLMALIIRSGIAIRREKRPQAFWAPKKNPSAKVSFTIWFHQSLDLLWLANGILFVILLFVTGQWMRIVPTSWEAFPNALSAALQYASLDWPTENGWVNYNSLQVFAYFTTVFIAAPLSAITGIRTSGLWPARAKKLSALFPMELARAIHFPVMIYFVAFIAIHVFLVFTTGALRNLNHMYAAQDVVNWTGFWMFTASLVVIAIAWVLARPLVLAPIARLFGNVTSR